MKNPLIIGLTGNNCSGKGEVASILVENGFRYYSLSDIVRNESISRGLSTCRDDLIATGIDLRNRFGPGVLAEKIIPFLGNKNVVDSIRNPGEVKVLRGIKGFVLWGIAVSLEVRFERSLKRARNGDPITLEEFKEKEEIENADDESGQRLSATFSLADKIIENNGSLKELRKIVLSLINKG